MYILFIGPQPLCQCGKPNRRGTRIQGGTETEVNEYPWQAVLAVAGWSKPYCGATVISNQHVLTTARCCRLYSISKLRVLLREHNTNDKWDGQLEVQASSAAEHPLFKRGSAKYDLCVVRLAVTLDFPSLHNRVAPVCLPMDTSQLYVGRSGIVTGWGHTATVGGWWGWQGTPSATLQETSVKIVDNKRCPAGAAHASILCTEQSSKGPCRIDTGGPLVVENANSRYDLVGVLSAAGGWRSTSSPRASLCIGYSRLYIRVTDVLTWINQQTAGSTTCCP